VKDTLGSYAAVRAQMGEDGEWRMENEQGQR